MAGMSVKGPYVNDSEEAEVLACRKAIEFTVEASFSELVIEGDSANVMRAISIPLANKSLLGHIYEDIFTSVAGGNNETDRLALLEFKAKIINDPFRVMSSWNDSFHFCRWRGVTCGRRHQRVTMLDLQSSKLVGSISPHVGNLSFLRILTLQNNSFHDEIPLEIGRLRRLQFLLLSNNTFSGKIPSNISNCPSLEYLRVGGNLLTGEIPVMLGTMSKLRVFSLSTNNLIGRIPPSFGNLSFLELFVSTYNNLHGVIPDSLGQLTKLELLGLGANKLFGKIPHSIFNISSINMFDIADNQIQGHLPSDIGLTLPNIKLLYIGNNRFTGSIPVSISNASNLDTLTLNDNKLRGKVPSLEKLNRFSRFTITGNNLGNGGANDLNFICSLTNTTYLTVLSLNINKFGGELPKCIGNLSTSLAWLLLDANKIYGKIPT
ncbi:LRR receptor-like serine/threonine-protein kinase EFR [Quercus lobata]|uniref:LRR receptor-like serine/threonine-protein kinase EFR n=1 Tax=Quercus lobata TaxID=97700 RepID=UPI0012457CA1|nr:LRR receptor-like serine/threonine-protein kinase EFR [Quercus lobata]